MTRISIWHGSRLVGAAMSLLLGAVGVARADSFSFSYGATDGTLTGTLFGQLQTGGNMFDVTGMGTASWNTVPLAFSPTTLESYDAFTGYSSSTTGIVTIDGTYLDLIACDACAVPFDGFALSRGNLYTAAHSNTPFAVFSGTQFGGSHYEVFNPSNWSASVTLGQSGSAPEPKSGWLFLAGIALLASARLRRRPLI